MQAVHVCSITSEHMPALSLGAAWWLHVQPCTLGRSLTIWAAAVSRLRLGRQPAVLLLLAAIWQPDGHWIQLGCYRLALQDPGIGPHRCSAVTTNMTSLSGPPPGAGTATAAASATLATFFTQARSSSTELTCAGTAAVHNCIKLCVDDEVGTAAPACFTNLTPEPVKCRPTAQP